MTAGSTFYVPENQLVFFEAQSMLFCLFFFLFNSRFWLWQKCNLQISSYLNLATVQLGSLPTLNACPPREGAAVWWRYSRPTCRVSSLPSPALTVGLGELTVQVSETELLEFFQHADVHKHSAEKTETVFHSIIYKTLLKKKQILFVSNCFPFGSFSLVFFR